MHHDIPLLATASQARHAPRVTPPAERQAQVENSDFHDSFPDLASKRRITQIFAERDAALHEMIALF
jgi:hypothetical protein